jgi:peroxiredoxin
MTINTHDSALGITAFKNSHGYTVPMLRDAQREASLEYSITAAPMTFFIDRNGVIRYIKRGAFANLSEIQGNLDKLT